MMVDDSLRKSEQAKYVHCYKAPPEKYSMGGKRKKQTKRDLLSLPCRGSFLDVACGRGEMLDIAEAIGFTPCKGTEIVPNLIDEDRVVFGECHSLPFTDNSFDVVGCFDVIEHLLPGDDGAACREMERVARHFVLFTVSNGHSTFKRFTKKGQRYRMLLHINRRDYNEWDSLFRQWFEGKVTFVRENRITATWKVELQ